MLDNQQVSFPKNKNENKNKEKDEEKEVEKKRRRRYFCCETVFVYRHEYVAGSYQ